MKDISQKEGTLPTAYKQIQLRLSGSDGWTDMTDYSKIV